MEHVCRGYQNIYGQLTDYEHKIVPLIRTRSKIDWFRNQTGSWNDLYQVPFAEVLTSRGFGFAFNVMNSSDIYKVDK